MLLIALMTLLLANIAAGTTTTGPTAAGTTTTGPTVAGSTNTSDTTTPNDATPTDATNTTDAATATDAANATDATTITDATTTTTDGAAATNATTTAPTPGNATSVNMTTVNMTTVNTTPVATTPEADTTEADTAEATISHKPSETPTTTNQISMEPQPTDPGPIMPSVGTSAVPPMPAPPSVIPSTARPSTTSTTTRSTTLGGLTVPPTVPSSWPKLDPPNVTVSTGQSYLYQISAGTMQTVQAGAYLLYDFMSEGLKMRKSGMPNSWISLGGSDTKVVRVRVRQFHPSGNAQSPWSEWRANTDHMSAVDAVIRFGNVDRTTCATMLQNPTQLLGFAGLATPFIHDHLSNHAIVSQIGDVSFTVKNVSCGSLIVKATIGALMDQPDAVLETALKTNIRGKTIHNLEITDIQTMETDASSIAFVVRQFDVKRVNKTMLHFGWSLVGADSAAEHALITCEKTSKDANGSTCPWVMDNYQSIPRNTEMLSLNCESMCDTINGEYKFKLHVKIPVQGGNDRLPSFDSNLDTVARFATCGLNSMCDYDENSETCGCLCDEGYTYNSDVDICEDITDDCAEGACSTVENSRCVDGPAMADCVCNSGFHMIGDTCMDMDECHMGTPCDKNMLCMNTPGTFNCSCPDKTKWEPVTQTCIDKDECATPDGNMCLSRHGTHSTCFNTVGNLTLDPYYRCECESGYIPNYNGTCVEKNECTDDPLLCSSVNNSMCVNTMGSYECECMEGYVKSGDNCIDADSCASSPCPSGLCTDGVGTYSCYCNGTDRLQADNTCTPFAPCSDNSSCTLSASYCESGSCMCKTGLVLKGSLPQKSCDNINECEIGIDTCADNEVCRDDVPGYTCSPRLSCLCNGNEDCNDKGKCYMPPGGKCFVKTFHSDIGNGKMWEQGCAHSEDSCDYSSYDFSMGCCNTPDCNTKSSAPSLGTTVIVTYTDVTPENEADAVLQLQPSPSNAVITSVTLLCSSDCASFSPFTHSFNGTHLVIPNIHPGSAPHTANFVIRSLILHGVNPLLPVPVHFAPTLTNVNVTQISDDDFHITWTTTRTDSDFVLTVAAVCGQSGLKCDQSRMTVPANGMVRMSSILTPGMKYVLKFEAHFMNKVSPPMYRDITYSINECLPNMMINHTCAHEKACVDTPESFECLKVLPCFPGLCQNSVCNDTDKGFSCVCNAGFMQDLTDSTHTNCIERKYCEMDNPCMHGGTCSEATEGFTCDCTDTGFTGRACNEITLSLPVNETVYSPLRNTTIDKEKEEVDFQFCTNSELHCNKKNSQCYPRNYTVTDVFDKTYDIPGLCQCVFPYIVEIDNRCELGKCKCGGLNAKGCDQNGFCTSMETQCYTKTEFSSNRQVEYSQGCIQTPAEKSDVCINHNYVKAAHCCTVSAKGNVPCNFIDEESVNQYPVLDKVNVTVRDVGTMADVVFLISPPSGVQVINTTFTCTENCARETYTLAGDVFNKTVTPTGIDRSRPIRYMFAFVFANAMDVHLNVSVMPSPPRVVEAQLTANDRQMYATWRLQRKPDGTYYTKIPSVVILYCVPLSHCENRTTTVWDRYEWPVSVVQGLKYALDVHTVSNNKTTPVFTSTPVLLPITTTGLRKTRATTTSLVLGWSYNDDNAKVLNCKVSYPGGLASTVQGKRTHFQLNNLTPDHRYEVSIECCSAKQPTCVYGPRSRSRMYTLPGTITNPKLLRISSSKATLKWTLPRGYSVQSDVSVLSYNHLPLTRKHVQLFANRSGCYLKDLRSSSRYSLIVRLSSRYPGQERGGAKTFKFDTLAEGVFSGIEPWLWVMIGVGAVVMLIALLLLLSICFFTADKPRIDPDIDFIYNRSRHSGTVAAEEAMTK